MTELHVPLISVTVGKLKQKRKFLMSLPVSHLREGEWRPWLVAASSLTTLRTHALTLTLASPIFQELVKLFVHHALPSPLPPPPTLPQWLLLDCGLFMALLNSYILS